MDYNATVEKVMNLLKEKEVCASSQKSHEDCYNALGQFLNENDQEYSAHSKNEWFHLIKREFPRQRCMVWNQYLLQLEEMSATGTVSDHRLYLNKSNYEKLPPVWKKDLDLYLEDCRSRYTIYTWELTRKNCAEALLLLYDNGYADITMVTYQAIIALIEMDMFCSKETKALILVYTARLMRFFGRKGLCPDGFSLLLDSQTYSYIGKLEDFSLSNQDVIDKNKIDCRDFSVGEFRETIGQFIKILENHGYVGTTLKLAHHLLTALYLFLDIHELGYHPDIIWAWFSEVRKNIGSSWRHWRRLLRSFEEYTSFGDVLPAGKYNYGSSSLELQPEWCRQAVNAFLDMRRREFLEERTVQKSQYPCIRFCRFLIDYGIRSFKSLTPEIIKEFSLQDVHSTFKGRSGYFTTIRGFLRFLEEKKYTNRPALYNCLLAGSAPEEKLVDVLSEEQVQRIDEFRKQHHKSIELRDAAIVMLGTKMGLRASDVLNLKFENIDWRKREISIVMKKTRMQITLPMPIDVGNAIYSYLTTGRPSSADRHVFIRSKAPYGKLTGKVCTNALYRILPERSEVKGGGFHVTRRTFATNLLRNQADVDEVMNALGHTDSTSVMKYLFMDEERTGCCALSLADVGLSMKGGLA